MKKKWIVIPSALVVAAGIVATMPIWAHLWQRYVPQAKVAIDAGTTREAIDGLITQYNRHYTSRIPSTRSSAWTATSAT